MKGEDTQIGENTKTGNLKTFSATLARKHNDKPVIAILTNYLNHHPEFPHHTRLAKKILSWAKCGAHLVIDQYGNTQNKYCDNRTCTICANNRKKDHEAKYGNSIDELIRNPERATYLTTLTAPNCTTDQTKNEIAKHAHFLKRYSKNHNDRKHNKAKGETFNAKSALEITYNDTQNEIKHHPHTHILHQSILDKYGKDDISVLKPEEKDNGFEYKSKPKYKKKERLTTLVNGKKITHTYPVTYGNKTDGCNACNVIYQNDLIREWLIQNPEANKKAQNVRRCYDKAELIKYTTKTFQIDKKNRKQGLTVNAEAILTIMNSLHGVTTSAVYGTLRNKTNKGETQSTEDEHTGDINEETETISQQTNLKPGKYSIIVNQDKATIALTEEHLPMVDEETGEIELNENGEPLILKIPTYEEIETWTPTDKQIKRWSQIENNYYKTQTATTQ